MRKIKFDKCIIGTGKSGIDFSSKLAKIAALNAALCEKNAIFSVSLRVISKNLW